MTKLYEEVERISMIMNYNKVLPISEQGIGSPPMSYISGIDHMVANYPHELLMFIEMGSLIGAMIPTPLSPILFGISITAGLADAAVYYFKDGNLHSALIAAALTVIPEAKLAKFAPKLSKWLNKFGLSWIKNTISKLSLIEKGKKGIKLLKEQKKFIKEIIPEISNKSFGIKIKNELVSKLIKNTSQYLIKLPIKGIIYILRNVFKYVGLNVAKIGLMIGGIYITVDKLYLYFWGDDEDRNSSEMKEIADIVKSQASKIKSWLLGEYKDNITQMPIDKLNNVAHATNENISTYEELVNKEK